MRIDNQSYSGISPFFLIKFILFVRILNVFKKIVVHILFERTILNIIDLRLFNPLTLYKHD